MVKVGSETSKLVKSSRDISGKHKRQQRLDAVVNAVQVPDIE